MRRLVIVICALGAFVAVVYFGSGMFAAGDRAAFLAQPYTGPMAHVRGALAADAPPDVRAMLGGIALGLWAVSMVPFVGLGWALRPLDRDAETSPLVERLVLSAGSGAWLVCNSLAISAMLLQ
jgi:hypothetical protein